MIKAILNIEKRFGIKVEYELVGGVNSDRLLKVAQRIGVINNVKFKGALPHNEVFLWLDSLDSIFSLVCKKDFLEHLSKR